MGWFINNYTTVLWYTTLFYPHYSHSYDPDHLNPYYHNVEYHNPHYHYPNYHNPNYHSPHYHHNTDYHYSDYHRTDFHDPEYHNSDFHDPNCYHNPNFHNLRPGSNFDRPQQNKHIVPSTSTIMPQVNIVPTTSTVVPQTTEQNVIQKRISTKSEQECMNFQKLNTQQYETKNNQQNIDYNTKYPHRVALGAFYESVNYINFLSRAWYCGGSLINEKFILTAAHCLTFQKLGVNVSFALIGPSFIGAYTTLENPYELIYNISRRIPHPLYKPPSIYHDIALVELDRPVEFNAFIRPACLYFNEQIDTNLNFKTSGWQFTYLGVSEKKIEETNLQLFSNNECGRTYKDFQGSGKIPNGIIDKIQICAGEFEQDTCKADSGSPLEIYVNTTNGAMPYLVGIKSFGNTCQLKGIPGIYTRIAPYVPWIESVAWNEPEINAATSDLEQVVRDVGFRSGDNLLNDASRSLKSSLSERKCLNYREDKESEFRVLKLNYIQYPFQPYVSGGVDAMRAEFPHMVALGYSRPGNTSEIAWKCGGTLISEKFVLTAAHCLSSSELGNVSWAQLTLDLDVYKNLRTPEQIVYKIIRRIPHPTYKRPLVYHDIALLELDRAVEFNEDTRPACLHTELNLDPNLQIIATGWGVTEKGEEVNRLQRADLDTFNHSECSNSYENWSIRRLRNGIVDNNQICAGKRDGIQDTCPGDSGGPLQFKIPNYVRMSHIVGVTSFGKSGCGFAGSPGVYTRVAAYVPWIESIVWPDEFVPNPNQPQVEDA